MNEYVTVGQLRKKIADLPDDMPVMVKSWWDEFELSYVYTIMQQQVEFGMNSSAAKESVPDDEYDPEPVKRQCLILEDE